MTRNKELVDSQKLIEAQKLEFDDEDDEDED